MPGNRKSVKILKTLNNQNLYTGEKKHAKAPVGGILVKFVFRYLKIPEYH